MYPTILKSALKFASTLLILVCTDISATIVEVETSQGSFQINLHDTTTPATVANFLAYVNDGGYTDTIFHRSVANFIVQGGGYVYDGNSQLVPTVTNAPVTNEPIYSNVVGTIAMAKVSGNLNSATNQWFINTANNSANLDLQNGGFTVFGQVISNGMTVVNTINDISRCGEIPMVNYTAEQCSNTNSVPGYENFITIYSITIVDSNQETDQDLAKIKNTLINQPTTPTTPDSNKDSGGGSLGFWVIFSIALLLTSRLTKFN